MPIPKNIIPKGILTIQYKFAPHAMYYIAH